MTNLGWFDKILVATDGSASSFVAEELAAFVAEKFKSSVTVIHAILPGSIGAPLVGPGEMEYAPIWWGGRIYLPHARKAVDEITQSEQQRGTALVADAAALFKKEGIEIDQKIEIADSAEAILNEAEGGNYNLIVIGSGGETARKRHLGSVAKKVVSHAKTSVLIARERSQISKILVPVDGSENSQKAFEHAVALAREAQSEITVLNVLEPSFFRAKPEMSREVGNQILSQAAGKAGRVKLDQRLEPGHPAETIIRIAQDENFDLIVMGRRGHGVMKRWLLGSVTDHVTNYTDRSVLIVK